MGLFKLTAPINVNVIEKDKLFFDKYEYSLCFTLKECGVLRERSELGVLKAISWRNSTRRNWGYDNAKDIINEEASDNLLDMWNKLQQHKDRVKFVFSYDLIYLYGNDLKELMSIATNSYTTYLNYVQQANVCRPRDVVLKSNPKFKLRSYFKDMHLETDQQALLRNYLTSRPDSYGFSNVFRMNLNKHKWFYLQRHQWIEHDDPKDLTMLSLVLPGLIRKTVSVQAK